MKFFGSLMITAILASSCPLLAIAESVDGASADGDKLQVVGKKNPFTSVPSIAAAESMAGFSVNPLKIIPSYYSPEPIVSVLNGGEMIQIEYEEPLDKKRITYRASKKLTSEVMNGDYSEYDRETDIKVGSYKLHIQGSDEVIYTAQWQEGGINYCLLIDDGLEDIELQELLLGASAN